MNRLFLLIAFLLAAVVATVAGLGLSAGINRSLKQLIHDDIVAAKRAELRQISRIVRNDIVIGNIRGARITLEELRSEHVFLGFEIQTPETSSAPSDEASSLKTRPDVESIVVPVKFNDQIDTARSPTSDAGQIEFFFDTGTSSQEEGKVTGLVVAASVIGMATYAAIFGGLFAIFFWTTKRLVPVFEARMRGDGDTIASPGRLALLAWQPLLSAFAEASARVARWRVEAERARQFEAIARTTQMLAHDVRRPFTSLKMALRLLRDSRGDQTRVNILLDRMEDTIPKSIAKVEGLIADVMEIGSDATPRVEACLVAGIFEEAMVEVFPDGLPPGVSLSRAEGEDLVILAERRKVLRALANVLQNAGDALRGRGGTIRTEAKRLGDGYVRLTIWNTNSHIPADVLPKIFDSFYTAKRGGTGLGLAIAKKVTEAHGGSISCESSLEEGVAFHMDLPGVPTQAPQRSSHN